MCTKLIRLVQEVDIKTLKLDFYLLIGWFEHEPAQSNALLQVLLYGEGQVTSTSS
jgi:hypothetical protein